MALSKVSLVAADTVSELTSGSGVTVDGSLLKDTEITTGKVIGNGDTNTFIEFAGSDVVNVSAGGGDTALRIDANKDVLLFGPGSLHIYDDHCVVFGDGNDYNISANPGETELHVYSGTTNTTSTNEGEFGIKVGDSADSYLQATAGEGSKGSMYLYADQGDDTNDRVKMHARGGGVFDIDFASNTDSACFKFNDPGRGEADSTWDDNAFDYAELFEWKTPLSNESDINALWGKTVILDGNKVRIAETGEEDKVIGIVRPKHSTTTHGDGLQWGGKYKQDVWGNYEMEEYTQVTWQEFRDGGITYRHSYPKDEIPAYRLKKDVGRDKNSHTKESNFELDKNGNKIPVVVPNTNTEKTAANYKERTTHKITNEKLIRKVYSDTYDPSKTYVKRNQRVKEWVLIGMLGQVPVRDSTIIPTHWKKMKNLESGIDKYFIFNK
jgi:hypothetical protein